MHPEVYNKLQLTNTITKRNDGETACFFFKTESEGAHTKDSDKLFHSEIT